MSEKNSARHRAVEHATDNPRARSAAELIHAITNIDMPLSADKCESYLCEHWAAKASVIVDIYVQAAVAAERERCATMAEQIAHRHRVAMDCKPGDFCEDFGCADWLSFAAVLRAPPDPGPHS